ncbi:MAG TPA: hypothetical protein VF649_00675 [Sphingomonas sp.]|jgi:hypothetical protein|uniref:hypothetical protein n=1 Tax=Sphingomonas sp. TaxID=28214 RepID=UPI002EDB6750
MIALALIGLAAAMLLIRLGWGGRRVLAAIGWGLGIVGLAMLTITDGAWGLAIGTVTAMAVALILVLREAWTAPARSRRAARTAPSITLPQRRRDLARRLIVFMLVVPGAFAAAQWLAFGAQAFARRGGAGDADAIVLALFLQPTAWAAIMAIQMTRAAPVRMIAAPLTAAMIGTILWEVS